MIPSSSDPAAVQVVAHQPEHNAIRLWVDTSNLFSPTPLRVVDDIDAEVDARMFAAADALIDDGAGSAFPGVHEWRVEELAPGTAYRVADGEGATLATFRTLPAHLPLTIAVGSCYSVDDDPASPAGQVPPPSLSRFRGLRRWGRGLALRARAVVRRARPLEGDTGGVAARYLALAAHLERVGRPIDFKLLLGDQVYVDQPPRDYLLPRGEVGARGLVAARYRATWRRLGSMLSCGANICVSEDHEYWNNYPYRPAWLWLWWGKKLAGLRDAAVAFRSCYQQTPVEPRTFGVGSAHRVEFFVADTRCQRTTVRPDATFMDEGAFDELLAWIGGLDGPGVIVLGQPLLTAPGRRRVDTTLANYPAQHGALCAAINAAEHDIVVICGDVHYGRCSVVPLASGRQLIEVVSSPMALLAAAGSKAKPPVAPRALDAVSPDPHAISVEYLDQARPDDAGEDHLTVLTFDEADDGVRLRVTPYYTRFTDEDGVPRRAGRWRPFPLR